MKKLSAVIKCLRKQFLIKNQCLQVLTDQSFAIIKNEVLSEYCLLFTDRQTNETAKSDT